jgi:hypothetical protein
MIEDGWVRVYTGDDFTTSLLKVELEDAGIAVKVRSDKDAGLHAGFASSGFAQIYVPAEKEKESLKWVKAFEEKMK